LGRPAGIALFQTRRAVDLSKKKVILYSIAKISVVALTEYKKLLTKPMIIV
jgi:hypothetical protein